MTRSILIAATLAAGLVSWGTPSQAESYLKSIPNTCQYQMMIGACDGPAVAEKRQAAVIAAVRNDPRALAAYQAGICGSGLTWHQFAYKYAATGGCRLYRMEPWQPRSTIGVRIYDRTMPVQANWEWYYRRNSADGEGWDLRSTTGEAAVTTTYGIAW